MKIAQVVIHQGVYSTSAPFDYACPPSYASEDLVGRRVQVPWGHRPAEGIVIGCFERKEEIALKHIQKIMDDEPVLSKTMIDLGKWMAQFYACSLSACLRPMIPALLNRKRNICYILSEPAKKEATMIAQKYPFFTADFFDKITQAPMTQKEMEKWMTPEQIQILVKDRWMIQSAEYSVGNIQTADWVYTVIPEKNLVDNDPIGKQAVKQQALYQWLLQRGEIPIAEVREKFSLAVIQALQRKQKIQKRPPKISIREPNWQFNSDQLNALNRIQEHLQKQRFKELLLYGVTGSGKTEVYIQAILRCLAQGRNAMLLVPEIALAQQTYTMLKNRIPQLALFHSGRSAGERYEAWKRVKEGEARVVLGARSALFAPLENIGLLIIDEEQEMSYKSETMPCYHTVEVARQRMQMEGGVLLLGTATPTLENVKKTLNGSMEMLLLPNRVATSPSPLIQIENLRKRKDVLTPLLESKIQERLDRGEQTILFVNRRGYSPRTVCMTCGEVPKCPHCSVALVYHQDDDQNHCHYCNYHAPAQSVCSSCGEATLQLIGIGTQKLEALCKQRFPQASIARLDLDAAARKNYHDHLLQQLHNKEVDILIGTQMIAKGLHIPDVSLVAIVDADALLSLPDYRAAERAVQLLMQVSGRAGRADKQGEILIQTFQPENPLFQILLQQDYLAFARKELLLRQRMDYPPYTHLCRILTRSKNEEKSLQAIREMAAYAVEWLWDNEERELSLVGPAPCAVYKVQDQYRYQLLLKARSRSLLVSMVHRLIELEKKFRLMHVRLEIDFDPVQFI